jgi:hypothetical protein
MYINFLYTTVYFSDISNGSLCNVPFEKASATRQLVAIDRFGWFRSAVVWNKLRLGKEVHGWWG